MKLQTKPTTITIDTIGNTPLVTLEASPAHIPIYAKLEAFNPGGSVKDRIGKYIIEAYLNQGTLSPGGTIIEPTAGNTGIGLAIAATNYDIDTIFVVPERFSQEKLTLMRALGSEIIQTPAADGMDGAIQTAQQLAADRPDAVVPQQFANPLNAEAHYATTAPEIYTALDGAIGAFVIGCGTAGTLMGLAKYAAEQDSSPYIVAVEPEGSLFSYIDTPEDPDQVEAAHEYKIEGIGTHDPETNALFDPELVDEVIQVPDQAAHAEVARLAREEGHLVGSSAGAASVAAQRIATRIADGQLATPHDTVVTVFPDSGERYLSKGLYDSFEKWEP